MAASSQHREPGPVAVVKAPIPEIPKRRSHKWRWIAGILLGLALICGFGLWYTASHAERILRARVIDTLADRFKGKVELAGIDVSPFNGLAVHGTGLMIYGMNDPNPTAPGLQPLIRVEEFRFQTSFRALFRSPMHVHTVFVKGLMLNIPPKEDIQDLSDIRKSHRMRIVVDELNCEDTNLVINTRKPGKQPLVFAISHLKMEDIGAGQPMRFQATLVNPKPVGDIVSVGYFGPFQETKPRATPVSGDYSFSHADLGDFRGIAGILSSVGNYRGTLGRIEVDGETDTPDFRLARSGHPVPLHTDFHAIVDGTDGDTYLEPVKAKFLHTTFTASGKVVRVQNPKGHNIELNVVMNQARVEDLLLLGVKTDPPVLNGPIVMHAKMGLPPSDEDVADRLRLNGNFSITNAQFSNDKIQDRLDALSLRAQGQPDMAKEHVDVNVPSKFSGTFHLRNGLFQFPEMQFALPAVDSQFSGQYSLDGNVFDFHGKLRLRAKLSQMTTGWKSILLKPVDPFFSKHGAGTELPFKVTGTKSEPHFGLDFGHHDTEADGKPNGTH